MPVLYDARGNEYAGQLDQVTSQTFTDARTPTAALGAVNAEAIADLQGHATAMIDIRGTFVGTVVFEGTVDGTNYLALAAYNLVTGAYVASATAAVNVALSCAGYRRIRVRCSAFTSGSIVVAIRATIADFSTIIERIPATAGLTATAAAAAAVTLTIPAAGAGLFHYINWIRIEHFATALLTAAAAPVIVTTTNLPGTPSFNFRADAAPQGTLTEKVITNEMPIRSSAANTNTTVVCPATTAVIWRVTASYRVGA